MRLRFDESRVRGPKWAGVLFALIGLGILIGGLFNLQKRITILRTWPAIEAQVVNSEVTDHRDSDGDTMYSLRVTFRFALQEREHTASADLGYSTSSRNSMRRAAENFLPGTLHTIRYNPADPEDIRFNVGYTLGFFGIPAFLAAFGLIFLFVGVAVLRAKNQAPGACPACGVVWDPDAQVCAKCGAKLREA